MNQPQQQNYLLHWKTGDVEIIRGYNIADAVRCAGYGGGAFLALDYWEPESCNYWRGSINQDITEPCIQCGQTRDQHSGKSTVGVD